MLAMYLYTFHVLCVPQILSVLNIYITNIAIVSTMCDPHGKFTIRFCVNFQQTCARKAKRDATKGIEIWRHRHAYTCTTHARVCIAGYTQT